MIKKITHVKNFGILKDFEWDSSVVDKNGTPKEFQQINVLYGRNYSGKTTLSRILQSVEKNELPADFDAPEFSLALDNGATITNANLSDMPVSVRVFNRNFIRDNLKFIIDPNGSIEAFAILGEENQAIEEEILRLSTALGSSEAGEETGMFKEFNEKQTKYNEAVDRLSKAEKALEDKLHQKATRGNQSIKYNPSKFGDQNYTITRLKSEIAIVKGKDYSTISEAKKYEDLLKEEKKEMISTLQLPKMRLEELGRRSKELVERKISRSEKIEELISDAILNRWVNEGRKLHKGKREVCAFCANELSESRWSELEKHFDEESENLEKELSGLISEILEEVESFKGLQFPNQEAYYSKFHETHQELDGRFRNSISNYLTSLELLVEQLNGRKADIINSLEFKEPADETADFRTTLEMVDKLNQESNEYTDDLKQDQENAMRLLRLKEIHDFIIDIDYEKECERIEELKTPVLGLHDEKEAMHRKIDEAVSEIATKKALLKDESIGAERVNEFLNHIFGHQFLSLNAVEVESEEAEKRYKFEIQRDGKKAHNLSEGECSLIAFCYFIARLEDVETKGSKPIIWIDDPISSLDGNHIFFIYSLLKTEIVEGNDYAQLFVSTHNLDFLKYLKRLGSGHDVRYLIVERKDENANLRLMPKYLKNYVTEFNYLFEQIHACSELEVVDDTNFTTFYNFGNNARRFLEIYLYFKYPDGQDQGEKARLQAFFGDDDMPAILTDRINNEYSHLPGTFERGSHPIEVPEMNGVAKAIIDRIKAIDPSQFASLLKSIGAEPNSPPDSEA